MAIPDSPDRRSHPWRVLAGLFEEAWRRERRRRYRNLLLLALIGAAVVTIELTGHSGGDGTPAPQGSAARVTASIRSAYLPAAGGYNSLSVGDGQLLVTGGADEGYGKGSCASAVVNAATLRVTDVMHANCGDPALNHQRTGVLFAESTRHLYSVGTMEVRIATVDPRAPDGYTVGPVVMTFPTASDTWPTTAGDDGSLWIYGPVAGPHSLDTGRLVRISASTGKVLQHWALPSIHRPLMAADADGLWIAPSWLSGSGGDMSHLSQSLDLVVPGARVARATLDLSSGGAEWMVASGQTVWLETRVGPRFQVKRWRLRGPNAKVTAQIGSASNLPQGGDVVTGPSFFEGSAATGIYTLQVSSRTSDSIVWMNPDTLTPETVATVRSEDAGSSDPDAVVYDGSLFVLNPSGPASSGATGAHAGSSEITRVSTTATR